MEVAFDRLLSRIQPASVVVLFFAGHACEVDGVNYLLPIVDCSAMSDADLRYRGVSAHWMQAKVWERKPAVLLFILDACRNNPFRGIRSTGGGLAQMEPLGSLLLFACAPGQMALDGVGCTNSPLTTHLMQHLHVGEVHSAMRRVIRAVYESTEKRQHPWTHSDMKEDFYWHELEVSAAPQPQPPHHVQPTEPLPLPLLSPSAYLSLSPSAAVSITPPLFSPGRVDVSAALQSSASLDVHSYELRTARRVVALMRQHRAVGEVQRRACRALNELTGDEAGTEEVLLNGGLKQITAAMDAHQSDLELQRSACCVLSAIAVSNSAQRWSMTDAIKPVVRAMWADPSHVSTARCGCVVLLRVLRCEQYGDHNRWLVADSGGVERIVAAVRTHSADRVVEEAGLAALMELARLKSIFLHIVAVGGHQLFEGSRHTLTYKYCAPCCLRLPEKWWGLM